MPSLFFLAGEGFFPRSSSVFLASKVVPFCTLPLLPIVLSRSFLSLVEWLGLRLRPRRSCPFSFFLNGFFFPFVRLFPPPPIFFAPSVICEPVVGMSLSNRQERRSILSSSHFCFCFLSCARLSVVP